MNWDKVIQGLARENSRLGDRMHEMITNGTANTHTISAMLAASYVLESIAKALENGQTKEPSPMTHDVSDDFLAPIKNPTRYFDGQGDLIRLLESLGLKERDVITTVHLVARALQ